MCAGACNSLKIENILQTQTYTIEGMDTYSKAELEALRKDRSFCLILDGGILHCHLSIRCQVAEESGRLIYNGRPFNRSSWSWRPPKVIRMQGRQARESTDPRNNHPTIYIITPCGDLIPMDTCPCGGDLRMDHRGYLYCNQCNIIYE
jgi:hypothetical protein